MLLCVRVLWGIGYTCHPRLQTHMTEWPRLGGLAINCLVKDVWGYVGVGAAKGMFNR